MSTEPQPKIFPQRGHTFGRVQRKITHQITEIQQGMSSCFVFFPSSNFKEDSHRHTYIPASRLAPSLVQYIPHPPLCVLAGNSAFLSSLQAWHYWHYCCMYHTGSRRADGVARLTCCYQSVARDKKLSFPV